MDRLQTKYEQLQRIIGGYDALLVAFSGGVDSTFLLKAAHEVLAERVLAVTAHSAVHHAGDLCTAVDFCRSHQIRHLTLTSEEMDDPDFRANTPQRCYLCKRSLFRQLWDLADRHGIAHVAHGANCDDLSDYRPGHQAADEWGVTAPLVEAGWHKAEIREMAARMGLDVWNRPADACLATRIPYGTPISSRPLQMVATAEALLHGLGFDQCRVRHHDTIARVEVAPEQLGRMLDSDTRHQVVEGLQALGFLYVSLDLAGYRQGGLNVEIDK